MYLWFIRTFHVLLCIVLGIYDACLTAVLSLLGLEKNIYLRAWQDSLGPRPKPQFPPKSEPGEPNYPYSIWDYHGYIRTAIVVNYLDRAKVAALLPDYLELAPVPDCRSRQASRTFQFRLESTLWPDMDAVQNHQLYGTAGEHSGHATQGQDGRLRGPLLLSTPALAEPAVSDDSGQTARIPKISGPDSNHGGFVDYSIRVPAIDAVFALHLGLVLCDPAVLPSVTLEFFGRVNWTIAFCFQ